MGILENTKKYYALAAEMRALAEQEADPHHADRLRRVALAYEKRAWAMEDALREAPHDVGLLEPDDELPAPRMGFRGAQPKPFPRTSVT